MGHDKARLPFGAEQMLQRMVRIVSQIIPLDSIVVVAAQSQDLPVLPDGMRIVRDLVSYQGPLQGLSVGLQIISNSTDAVYATSCDVPLLKPEFIDVIFNHLADTAIAVPFDGEHFHPLAAVYRTSVMETIEKVLAAGELRPRLLYDRVKTCRVNVETLRSVDPDLQSLINLNHPADYHHALRLAGILAPHEKD